MQVKGFDGNFIEELKSRNDIVDVVSSYVPSLTKKGHNYWGPCPFHHEKTPSFSVNREQGFYKCFGCGVGGDVLSFLMAVDNLTFMEAVQILADRAHMEVPKMSQVGSDNIKEKKQRYYALLKDAARIYHANLKKPSASAANDYIKMRKITPESVIKFGLGYSDGYESIIADLAAKGYKREEMLSAGVIQERDGRFFDAMANRLVFPIIDSMGNVIAFGGRVLGKTDFAKYKNTNDTLTFAKNRNLYGLNYIKKLRLKQRVSDLIMVEGYMDTLALHQAGVENVVASMGTSLTEEQAKLAKRYVEDIYICYDGDSAGQNATLRGLDILKSHGLKVKVISLPGGEDPDEIIKRAGVQAFIEQKNKAVELTEYKLLRLKEKFDFSTPDGRASYAKDAVKIIAELDTDIEREVYYDYVSKATGLKAQVIKNQVSSIVSKENVSNVTNSEIEATDANVAAATYVLRQSLYGLAKWENYASLMPTENLRVVADYLNECTFNSKAPDVSIIYHLIPQEEADKIVNLDVSRYESVEEKAYKDCVHQLEKEYKSKIIAELNVRYINSTSDEDRAELMKRIAELQAKK